MTKKGVQKWLERHIIMYNVEMVGQSSQNYTVHQCVTSKNDLIIFPENLLDSNLGIWQLQKKNILGYLPELYTSGNIKASFLKMSHTDAEFSTPHFLSKYVLIKHF